jgi:hypothetical protein
MGDQPQQMIVRGPEGDIDANPITEISMKKVIKRSLAVQTEFAFCEDKQALVAPPIEAKVTCCSQIPDQRTHRPWVPIFAGKLSFSPRNGWVSSNTPKHQDDDPPTQGSTNNDNNT